MTGRKRKSDKPTRPTPEEPVKGYSGPPIRVGPVYEGGFLYQCPSCGKITTSISERAEITCRKCGTPYFKHAAEIGLEEIFDRAEEEERRGDVDFDDW